MSNNLSPYVVFNGQAREALEFWQSVLGGDVRIMTFGDMGAPAEQLGDMPADFVMHGQLTTTAGWTIMAADSTKPGDEVVRGGMNLCVWGSDEETLARQFEAMSSGGTVNMPLEKQMWGARYGDLTDKFGISWGFNIEG